MSHPAPLHPALAAGPVSAGEGACQCDGVCPCHGPVNPPVWRPMAASIPGKLSATEVQRMWFAARAWCRERAAQRIADEEQVFGPLDTRVRFTALDEVV